MLDFLRATEKQYRILLEAIDEGFCTVQMIFDADGKPFDYRLLETNPAFERQTGLEKAAGKTVRELVPNPEEFWFDAYGRVARTGEPTRFEHEATSLGKYFEVSAFRLGEPGENRVGVLFNDISARKRTEKNLAFLADASQDLMGLDNVADTMQVLGAKIGVHFGVSLVSFAEVDEAQEAVTVKHAWSRQGSPDPRGVFRIRDFHSEEFRRASRAGETYVVRDAASDARIDAEALAAFDILSLVNVPLLREDRWRFQLTMMDAVPRDWRDDEIALLRELTTRIWTRLERARAEEELQDSEIRRHFALAAADLGTFLWHPQEDRGEPDAKMLRLFGLRDDEPLNLSAALTRIIHPDDLGRYADAVGRAIDPSGDGRLSEEIRVIHPDKSIHWVAVIAQTVFEGHALPLATRMYGTAADITARKQAEERQDFLLKVADTLRILTDPLAAQGVACRILAEHLRVERVIYAEIAGTEMIVHREHASGVPSLLGRQARSAFGRKAAAAFFGVGTYSEEDLAASPEVSAAEKKALRALAIRAYAGSTLAKKGRVAALIALSAHSRRFSKDEVSLVADVADRLWAAVERARAEAAVREGEERYRSLFDAIDEGFNVMEVLFDDEKRAIDCRILEINPAYLRHTGLPPSVVGRRLREILPGIDPKLIARYGRVATSGRASRFEEYVGPLDRYFDCYASRVGGEGSRTIAVVFDNVTEEKRAAEKLREADRRKSDFLAMLGHELRNPLAAVDGGIKLLQSPKTRPESREATLPIVAQQVAHMKRLIDDVLDLARLERGKLQVQLVEVDLGATIGTSIQMTASLAQAKGSPIRYTPPATPILLHADPERLMQVFANLLTNALKFSPTGSPVDIAVEATAADVVVRVQDYGQGIAPEHLAEIFEPFVQSKLSLGIPEAGLGLGLSVSRELVELHGGNITALSAGLDQGSTFVVSLPRR